MDRITNAKWDIDTNEPVWYTYWQGLSFPISLLNLGVTKGSWLPKRCFVDGDGTATKIWADYNKQHATPKAPKKSTKTPKSKTVNPQQSKKRAREEKEPKRKTRLEGIQSQPAKKRKK